jgi:hypothetical protein
MAQVKKPAKSKLETSASSRAIAAALVKHFPKDAKKIVTVMRDASMNESTTNKLGRVLNALESPQQKEPQQ